MQLGSLCRDWKDARGKGQAAGLTSFLFLYRTHHICCPRLFSIFLLLLLLLLLSATRCCCCCLSRQYGRVVLLQQQHLALPAATTAYTAATCSSCCCGYCKQLICLTLFRGLIYEICLCLGYCCCCSAELCQLRGTQIAVWSLLFLYFLLFIALLIILIIFNWERTTISL